MPQHHSTLSELVQLVSARRAPLSVAKAFELLSPLSIGLRQKIPVLLNGARLFRIRKMVAKPLFTAMVGAPPVEVVPVGRLNDHRQSVLYLADSPDTAFAEARALAGQYCLSEWRVEWPRVALANGGLDSTILGEHFPNDLDSPIAIQAGTEDHDVLALFTSIFTLSVGDDTDLYRWSIACGMSNGFAHRCERNGSEVVAGNTKLTGRFPFSGIAYRSTRKDRTAINYAFNDLGQTYLSLNHLQWVERHTDGSFSSIDIANSWGESGKISWEGRPAQYQLQSGQAAKVVKADKDTWTYENLDGSIPIFI